MADESARRKTPELIYVVEDDPAVAQLIGATLERFGFRHERFGSGGQFLRALRMAVPNLCILDLGLPDMDGMDLLHDIRSHHAFGLLIVTGRADTQDRVMGLELGADDYVTKPFEPRELIARVRSILRRYQPHAMSSARSAEFSGWRFDPTSNVLTYPDGRTDTLSVAEAHVLRMLLSHPNQILTREQLLEGRHVSALDRSIDLRISRLRRRLEEDPQHAKLIRTVYGAGYLFCTNVTWE